MFRFIRRYIRKNTLPIEPSVAWAWKSRFSLVYVFIAWNLLGFTVYAIVRDKIGSKINTTEYAKILGIRNAQIIQVNNLKKVKEYEINLTEQDINTYHELKEREEKLKNVKPAGGYWNKRWIDNAA